MILHPGVLALSAGSAAALFFVAVSCVVGVRVLLHWDYRSTSARQLALERQTYLASTVVSYALGLSVLSAFLFLHTTDDIHRLLVGAMCATGSLNANPIGWYALGSKIFLVFAAGAWICLNWLDQRAEDFPLVRLKYKLLLAIAPLVLADSALQTLYYLGIEPDVITSCCGSLFSIGGESLASSLSAWPPVPTLWAVYGLSAGSLVVGGVALRRSSVLARLGFGVLSALFGVVGTVALISVFSLYFYEMPTHHCPFDILQSGYGFIGYPVYGSLVVASLFGVLPAALQPLSRIASLRPQLEQSQRRWIRWSLLALVLFLAIVSYPVLFGSFRLIGYS